MASDSPPGDPDEAAALLRPAWADTPDETDRDLRPSHHSAIRAAHREPDAALDADVPGLLAPLCDATDALARLDARAAAAAPAIRAGLAARMALLEAAGTLAHVAAWIHPLDLALRERGLAPTLGLLTAGTPRALPHTAAAGPTAWDDTPVDDLPDGDHAVADALTLARLLRRLPDAAAGGPRPPALAAALRSLGATELDPARFSAWWTDCAAAPPMARSPGRAGQGAVASPPPLLAAARAAAAWLRCAPVAQPSPAQALLLATALLARRGTTHSVFAPVWAAYPAVGFAARDALPGLRSDTADRLVGRDRPVSWPVAFLHLVAESTRMGARELDRLTAAAAAGRELAAGADRRSRLADAVAALLAAPALTPKALAARLKVAPQTGTALLRELQANGVARELTGRGSFRAFAL